MKELSWQTMRSNLPKALGCVRFQNEEEWDGTVPHLDPIPVFGCAEERNQLVPQKGIFPLYAEPTHSTKSVECGGTAG
jgi:hypothetical protein